MVGGASEGVADVLPLVALAVDGEGRGHGAGGGEHHQGAEGVDQVGVDHHLGGGEVRLLGGECGEKFLFRLVLAGDEMVLADIANFVAHGFLPVR